MAQVAHDPALAERIDEYLDYLTRTWEGVPLDAAEWDAWDEHSRLVYDIEWGVPRDRLAQLSTWAEQGRLTSEQRARFDELRLLVTKYEPLLALLVTD